MRALTLALAALAFVLTGCAPAVPVPTFPPGPPAPSVPLPVRIEVPAIGAAGDLVALGLNPDGTMAVPPVTAPGVPSWYELGPRPGEVGPAVVAGHVDGGGQPGIFARLAELEPGDLVHVDRADGSRVTFAVTRVESFDKDRFPTEQVYGDKPDPQVVLITCGGAFDPAAESYERNVVAWAEIV